MGFLGNSSVPHDLGLHDLIQLDNSCLIKTEYFVCFFRLFSLIRHTFSILSSGYRQPGNSCAYVGGERGLPAGTHFVSWLNCYPNSLGYSAPQIIFPLNWFFQLVLYISYRVLYYFPHRAFLLMIPKQADKNSIFSTEIFRLLRPSLAIITSWKNAVVNFFLNIFILNWAHKTLGPDILRL